MTEISHTETFQAVLFDLDGTLLPWIRIFS